MSSSVAFEEEDSAPVVSHDHDKEDKDNNSLEYLDNHLAHWLLAFVKS